ncbi:MAG: glycosyl transferase, group 1 [Solirubrobacterales bacterium]|jgi:glycosyltransferase involved in cell wall biosynthesis|nr:glycosyl transferase, group 1 [Solirubrobacterales bacterium]
MTSTRGRRLLMIEQGGRGGVTDYTGELVRELAAEGWSVTLATAADHTYPAIDGVSPQPVFHYVRGETRVGRALREHGIGRMINGVRFLAAVPRLMRLARRADIVHTQGWEIPQIGLIAVLGLRLTGTPVIQTSHGTFERANAFLRTRLLVRRLTGRLLARTIVHTQADLERVTAWVGERAVVIPHGEYGGLASRGGSADRDGARAALGITPEAPVTLMFGQLRSDKGLDDLVHAVRRVPSLHLLVGGQDLGALTGVREELADPELRDRVTVREGFLDMAETAELFAAADTVALPYRAASQSGVLLLAYGFGRPVVIYPTGGMVESVLDGETGWICSAADVEALAEALAASVQAGAAECLRRGERGRELAQERFSWPVIARRTGELYDEVLAG